MRWINPIYSIFVGGRYNITVMAVIQFHFFHMNWLRSWNPGVQQCRRFWGIISNISITWNDLKRKYKMCLLICFDIPWTHRHTPENLNMIEAKEGSFRYETLNLFLLPTKYLYESKRRMSNYFIFTFRQKKNVDANMTSFLLI